MSQGQQLVKQLEKATGQTQHIAVLIFDVRGFTNFCKTEGDSVNITNFVKRIYIKVIGEYFPDATYYKPTGDGLLIIFSCSPGKEVAITKSIVERSLRMVQDFPDFCKGDPLVYFKSPTKIGVGLSRGSGCCISSEGQIVDYSGKPLNLASRLSDMARPFGLVFDESVGSCILEDDIMNNFKSDMVYVKGVAEEEPITVYFTKETSIPSSYKRPLNELKWLTKSIETTIDELLAVKGRYFGNVTIQEPSDENQIMIEASFPIDAKRLAWVRWSMAENHELFYIHKQGKIWRVSLDRIGLITELKALEVQPNSKVTFSVIYPIKA
jgi:class 3 adenylate cyclase